MKFKAQNVEMGTQRLWSRFECLLCLVQTRLQIAQRLRNRTQSIDFLSYDAYTKIQVFFVFLSIVSAYTYLEQGFASKENSKNYEKDEPKPVTPFFRGPDRHKGSHQSQNDWK